MAEKSIHTMKVETGVRFGDAQFNLRFCDSYLDLPDFADRIDELSLGVTRALHSLLRRPSEDQDGALETAETIELLRELAQSMRFAASAGKALDSATEKGNENVL